MMSKSRKYLREMSLGNAKTAQKAYKFHMKPHRDGFLGKNHKQKILRLKKWRETSDREVFDFFYDIRERAKSALIDFNMLCEFLSEDQLKSIFTEQKKGVVGYYPLTLFLSALLPSPTARLKPKELEKLEKDQLWRKLVLEDLVLKALSWYDESGIFETDSHSRLLVDTMDAISIMSSGEKRVIRHNPDSYYTIPPRSLNVD